MTLATRNGRRSAPRTNVDLATRCISRASPKAMTVWKPMLRPTYWRVTPMAFQNSSSAKIAV
ncbi:hypothetical protein D3C85_1892690 [compost metagenome]